MNGAHDMGGMMGFGPVIAEKNEPVFHAPWERRAMALTLAMAAAGGWTIDQSRAARESQHPARYLAQTYYQIWIAGLEKLMVERGLVTRDELDAGKVLQPAKTVPRILSADRVAEDSRPGRANRAGAGDAPALPDWRACLRPQHPPGWSYPPSSLCARACRRRHARPWRACVSGLERHR